MKKILLTLSFVFGLTLSISAQQDWDETIGGESAPVIHKANKDGGAELPKGEVKGGSSPVGALAIPFAAMLGLYGLSSLRKKEE